jgi:hypothetical protein
LLEGRSVRLAADRGGGVFELQLMLHGGGLAQLFRAAAVAVTPTPDRAKGDASAAAS